MKVSSAILFCLPLLAAGRLFPDLEGEGENWAVLLAGAKDWDNYRYQADVSHSYQVLHANGIPDDHIVVMLYDDVANNPENIHPGQLFNEIGGPDVYTGMPKDYTGEEVTQDTFFKVLRGDEAGLEGVGSGKVIKSGPNDRIFLSMDDHGSPGFFYFPGFVGMAADDFAEVILELHADGKYKEIMVYMEACEGGTMFEDLYPDEVRLYAGSSSNTEESSWACEYSDEIGVWLACEFPLGWMRDTEDNDPSVRTLKDQFETVRDGITRAHVSHYGNMEIQDEVVGSFLGMRSTTQNSPKRNIDESSRMKTQDVKLAMLERSLMTAKDETQKEGIRQKIQSFKENRDVVEDAMEDVIQKVTSDENLTEELMEKKAMKITHWDCYNPSAKAFHNCFQEDKREHVPLYIHGVLGLCEKGYATKLILESIESVCSAL